MEFIDNDTNLTLIAGVFGLVWSAFKSSEWYRLRRDRRLDHALGIVETAVERTYESYVRAIKRAREDGKLTAAERMHARRLAAETAIEIARREGLNLLRIIGREHLERRINRAVKSAKG